MTLSLYIFSWTRLFFFKVTVSILNRRQRILSRHFQTPYCATAPLLPYYCCATAPQPPVVRYCATVREGTF